MYSHCYKQKAYTSLWFSLHFARSKSRKSALGLAIKKKKT